MNPVVHFELPAEDRKRITDFYTKAFGWKAQTLGEEHGHYVIVSTTETDETGTPKLPGIINGGIYMKDKSKPAQYPTVVIAVDDIRASMKDIEKAGGKVLGEPEEIPGYGRYVSFFDTEGNRISIIEPTSEMKEKKGS